MPRANKSRTDFYLPQFRDLRKTVTYAFRIEQVRPSYSYQMMEMGEHDEPLETWDYEVHSTCIGPAKFAGRVTKIRLSGRSSAPDTKYKRGATVGRLTLRGKVSEVVCWLPLEALHWGMQHAIDGHISYLTVIADPLKNGYADAHVISFEADLDPEDFPGIANNG